MSIEVLRAAARAAVPWKNGGGVTHEVAVHPVGSDFDTFDWRVSIAQVHTAGPFSSLPGVDRRLAVLEGVLSIVIGAQGEAQLPAEAEPVNFAGEESVRAHPVGGPVTDLNVMTRRAKFSSRLALHRTQHATDLASGAASVLVVALTDLVLTSQTRTWRLSHLDAVRIEGEPPCEIQPQGKQARFYVAWLQSLSG
jgi:environmental stress-induced protein Ves